MVTKYLAFGSMCLSNCLLDSVGQCGPFKALFNCLKSATSRTFVESCFGTAKAFDDHSVG